MSCKATYAILEDDGMLDQFEAEDIPFKKAGSVQMRKLLFYPSIGSPDMVRMMAELFARKFVKYLKKRYSVRFGNDDGEWQLAEELGKLFAGSKNKVVHIAACVETHVRFPDEK